MHRSLRPISAVGLILGFLALASTSVRADEIPEPTSEPASGIRQELHEAGIQVFDNGGRVKRHTRPYIQGFWGMDSALQYRIGGAIGFRFRWDTSISAMVEQYSLISGGVRTDLLIAHLIAEYLIIYSRPLVVAVGAGPAATINAPTFGYGGLGRMTLRFYLFGPIAVQAEGAYRYLTGFNQSAVLASAGLHIDI